MGRERAVAALSELAMEGWYEAAQGEGMAEWLEQNPDAANAIVHWLRPCDLGDHDGPCWYESGTDDD